VPDDPRLTWVRVGDRHPDRKDEPDSFLALDRGEEVGFVRLLGRGRDAGSWYWSMWLTHPGRAFTRPTSGTTPTRKEAARALIACYAAFRTFYRIAD
jgi:hypothetical protein